MPTHEEVFEAAHAHVDKWEGGFCNLPDDPGGATNYGVSLMFLKTLGLLEGDINGDGEIDEKDVLALNREKAKQLIRGHFWDKPNAAALPPLIAVAFYDLAVNAGTGRAATLLQEGINMASGNTLITSYAPHVGPLTRRYSVELAENGNQRKLAQAYLVAREAWYRRLAVAQPTSARFLNGWLNRTNDCRTLLLRLATNWRIV